MTITIREPGSALTHLAGILLTAYASLPLLLRALLSGDGRVLTAVIIFCASMLALYTASTVYHTVNVEGRALRVFRKIDHMMIFVMIAGSYTPFCMLVLEGRKGHILLTAVWALAAAGMLTKAIWITCPMWFSSVIYILLGWICVFVFGDLLRLLPPSVFRWLLTGGIVYTAGGVIYAWKRPLFPQRPCFGNHELFHLFVLGGSACHFIAMFRLLSR